MYPGLGQQIVYGPEVQQLIAREDALKTDTIRKARALEAEYARLEELWNGTYTGDVPVTDRATIEAELQDVYQQLEPIKLALSDWRGYFVKLLEDTSRGITQRALEEHAAEAIRQAARMRTQEERDAAAAAEHRALQMKVATERAGQRQRAPNHSLDR